MADPFKEQVSNVIDGYLEDYSFEEFLENFDISPVDAFMCLFDSGLIDEELFQSFLTSDA
jgi:hypothetical protein